MLALESSRQQQFPYLSHEQIPLDSEIMDAYGYPAMQQSLHAPSQQPIYDPALWLEQPATDLQKQQQQQPPHMLFNGVPNSPPSMTTSQYSAASGASIASASSSAMGSPYSGDAHAFAQENWIDTANGLIGLPGASMIPELDFNSMAASIDADPAFAAKFPTVDPSAIHHPLSFAEDPQLSLAHHSSGFVSPAPIGSPLPSQQNLMPTAHHHMSNTSSPYLGALGHHQATLHERPPSSLSPRSHPSPAASSSNTDVEDEGREKRRCPWPECGRSFKDLKAHMLTHQSERPEKCPIVNCEYHLKGFARKYDKNRHTLTHYKGTMVCGFCPGSGSAAEKSFNRADVFKRHLMSVHGVEQTAPNCRKRSPTSSSSTSNPSSSSPGSAEQQHHKNLLSAGYSEDATGKCSTCSGTFSNAQDFYEHLDDCVLRVVQQEEPSEAINQKRLAEVAGDEDVKLTMEKHKLQDTASVYGGEDQIDEYDDENDDADAADDDDDSTNHNNNTNSNKSKKSSSKPTLGANSVTKNNKPRPITRRRGNRNSYPQSWGTPAAKMKTKKRVLCAYDGPRCLWKDEMMLDNEFEVRIRLPGGAGDGTNREAYVTDLDVMSLKRVEGVFSATEEERGPYNLIDSNERLMGQPVRLLPEVTQVDDLGIDIDELMAYNKESYHQQQHRPTADGMCV